MLIALISLLYSIREFRAAREHDRLSVRPELDISFYYNDAGAGWLLNRGGLDPHESSCLRYPWTGSLRQVGPRWPKPSPFLRRHKVMSTPIRTWELL